MIPGSLPVGGMTGANPLSGLAGTTNGLGGGGLGGLVDGGSSGGTGSGNPLGGLSVGPNQSATASQGSSFSSTLKSMVIDGPSDSRAAAADLKARFAMGDSSVDSQDVAIASAKAGIEVQMATRTISSAVSGVRTLFQMQI